MSKHICPRCGYEFEECNYNPAKGDNWSYFNVIDGSFTAICDNCHQKFTEGYTRKGILEHGTGGYCLIPIKQQYICSECAKNGTMYFRRLNNDR